MAPRVASPAQPREGEERIAAALDELRSLAAHATLRELDLDDTGFGLDEYEDEDTSEEEDDDDGALAAACSAKLGLGGASATVTAWRAPWDLVSRANSKHGSLSSAAATRANRALVAREMAARRALSASVAKEGEDAARAAAARRRRRCRARAAALEWSTARASTVLLLFVENGERNTTPLDAVVALEVGLVDRRVRARNTATSCSEGIL